MRNFDTDKLKFEPCTDGIAVLYHGKKETSEGGIILSGGLNNEKFPATGTIVAASKEALESGYVVGDTVLYNSYMAEDVPVDGVEVDILLTHNVLGKILI